MAKAATKNITQLLPRRLPEATREIAHKAIEAHLDAAQALIQSLDDGDGDPDFEPSLGAAEWDGNRLSQNANQTWWAMGDRSDLEVDCEDEGACETAMEVL